MANTLPGTPYVESSDLVANYPAVSESLAERVDLVGILPFATSTARGTALPTPTDGQYTYLQDTNSTEFWNGSAWQSAGIDPGLRIVTPTSIANSGGSASASGGAVSFTTVSSVSLNGVFTSAYENYRILIDATSSADIVVNGRFRASGTDASGSNYNRQSAGFFNTSSFIGRTTSANVLNICSPNGAFNCVMDIFKPQLAVDTRAILLSGTTSTSPSAEFITHNHNVSTAYDGFTILTSSGTITGTLRVYGYKNS